MSEQWRNRVIERKRMRVGDLRVNKWNPKGHPRVQQERQRAVLERFGAVTELVAFKDNDGEWTLFDGHLRRSLDEDQEWDIAFTDLTREEIDELVLYFDPLVALARQEADKTAALMAGLEVQERALREMLEEQAKSLGFVFGGNGGKAPEDPGPQIDRAEELQKVWQVQTGDLWVIPSKTADGEHRVICGDCTDGEVRQRLGIDYDMPLFTDPPYGISRDPSWLDGVGTHRQALSSRDVLAGDDSSLDLSMLWKFKRRMVWGFPYIYDKFAMGWIVWDKQPGVDGRGIVTPIEMASTTMRTGFDIVRVMWGGYYRAKGEDRQPHPTQKPIGVTEPFIESWTKAGEEIVDLFIGSGGIFVACERLGRLGRGIEIEPKYVAVTLQRLEDMGLTPKRMD